MLVEDIQLQVAALGAEILTLHPHLRLERWSHSLGETSELDGWTVGFVLHGLEFPLELAVDLFHIHRQPRVARSLAEWLVPLGRMGVVWVDFQGNKPFEDCRVAVLRAVERGSPQGQSFGATLLEVNRHFPEPHVKTSLTTEERAVYDCWLEHHRGSTPVPPHIVRQTESFGLFPKTDEARDRLALLLATRPEVVNALFPKEIVPPELLGPSVVIVDLQGNVEDFRLWRQLYRDKPLCSGLMYLTPIGFAEDRAALLILKHVEANMHNMIRDDAIDTGISAITFKKVGGVWKLVERQSIPWKRVARTLYAGPLYLATSAWAELIGIKLSGELLQPTLDLTWKLPNGSHQHLKVAPGSDVSDANTLYIGIVSPRTVIDAVNERFQNCG
ncbi:hypothetical protein IV102_35065 [bacterium]|nr:hypothetical protein [bacterium]